MDPNSREVLVRRREAATLTWRGPALMLFAREGIRLFDLAGFKRTRLGRDLLLGLALIPASLIFIYGGVYCGFAGSFRSRWRTPSWMVRPC